MVYRFLLSIIFASALVSCGHRSSKSDHMPTLKLEIVAAVDSLIPNSMTFVGQTQALFSYDIEPRVSGYLTAVNFSAGTVVQKGEVLFAIDAAPFEADMAGQRANLAAAQAVLTQAESDYKRSVPLAKINAISQSQLDAATAKRQSARESVRAAQATLRGSKLNLGYTVIKSPNEGIIAASAANVGDYVGVGTQYPVLTTIVNNEQVTVNLSLSTAKYYALFGGGNYRSSNNDSLLSQIELRLSHGMIYPHPGVYRYTLQNIDSQSGAIVFQVAFPNPDGVLKAGQFARISANVGDSMHKILVPQKSVNEIQGVYSIWVLTKENTADYRAVEVGPTWGEWWVIERGVAVGERVLTEGFGKLHQGMKVEPIENK